ncbi:ABC-2 transporter permease [Staphylococcus epidermidis]|uniref:ABC-2 transporter permease n=1 Tax=Staphylococcus epidermidis TaxID=1282 RepID=UPI00026BF13E|nr:ABC-2 transporter permease [Staphylococcus epidermidis]EJE27210.1 hypothetical protein HMPREF9974_07582 [Staphylococcus epidermidis NIH05005]
MKGLTLSIFYTAKKSFFIYLVVGIIAAVVFSFLNPTMNSFLAIIFLISPITDNFKREKDSRWMNYISTLPVRRADYVKSYYTIFLLCALVGILAGVPSVGLITQSFMVFISLCVAIGGAGTFSIMFPLTFKFGSENSNVIVMTTTFAVIIIYFLFYIASMILSNQTGSGSMITMLSNTQSYVVYSIYGILGLISIIISYILSIKIFNKQEL